MSASGPMERTLPEAGWYPDPSGGGLRYWDGRSWTADARPGPEMAPASASSEPSGSESDPETSAASPTTESSALATMAAVAGGGQPLVAPYPTVPPPALAPHVASDVAVAAGGGDALPADTEGSDGGLERRTDPRGAGEDARPGPHERFWRRVRVTAVVLLTVGLVTGGGAAGWWAHAWLRPATPVDIDVAIDRPVSQSSSTTSAGHMPSLLGLREDQARRALLDADVDPARINVSLVPAAGESGLIVDQEPPPGADITDAVLLGVSEPAMVPDVLGQQESDARDRFVALGSRVTVERVYREGAAEGTVLGTSPIPGEPLPQEVRLTVAAAPSSIFLTEMDAVTSACRSQQVDVSGETFPNAIVCGVRASQGTLDTVEYDIGRRASRLEAVLGQSDDGPTDRVVRIRVFADTDLVVDEQVGFGQQRPISVSVRDALRLRIEVTQVNESTGFSESVAVIGSPRLVGAPDDIDALARRDS